LSFEAIVEIRMATPGQRPETGDKIGRHEKRSPQFVLSHMNALVLACGLKRESVSPDYHMSQRDGVSAARQQSQLRERSTQKRAVRFDDTVDQRSTSAAEQCECQREAEQCRRASPEISQNPDHFVASHCP
jgi:hypothetical protein